MSDKDHAANNIGELIDVLIMAEKAMSRMSEEEKASNKVKMGNIYY